MDLNYNIVEHDTLTNFLYKHLNIPSSRLKVILKIQCNHGLVWSWFMRLFSLLWSFLKHFESTNVVFRVSNWLFG